MKEKSVVQTFKLSDLATEASDGQNLLDDMICVLDLLENEIVGKKFVYFYKRNTRDSQQRLDVCFPRESILHLMGISYYDFEERNTPELIKQPKDALEFYNDYRKEDLNFSKCWVESLNKVRDKVSILRHITGIKTSEVRIGEDGHLRTIPMTNTLSTPKIGLGIALAHDCPDFSIPRSCLNLVFDREAKDHKSFRNTHRCIKIDIYHRHPNGKWQIEERLNFFNELQQVNSNKKKKKAKKKKKKK